MIEQARSLALKAHQGQRYGQHDYEKHLQDVVALAVENTLSTEIIAGCWLHDTIEDCGVSYSEIRDICGEAVADIVYCVTDEPGQNRKARKQKTYPKIAVNEAALCVKLCDRIANLRQSVWDKNMRLVHTYCQEHPEFRAQLYQATHSTQTLALWEQLNTWLEAGNQLIQDEWLV